MSKRSRIFAGILLIYVAGLAFLLHRVLADLDPRYRESAEESLVETAQVFATLVEQDVRGGTIDTARMDRLFTALARRNFEANIYGVAKDHVDLRLYVVDANGRVLYDSAGRATGADFSQWRDVVLALRGVYGARTTAEVADDPASAVMYVAAPVRDGGRIIGAVSAAKPVRSFGQFVEAARRKTLYVGIVSGLAVFVLAMWMSVWLARPFGLIGDYVRYVRAQPHIRVGRLARRAVDDLRAAFDEMRDALAGRSDAAEHAQMLTHELKSPLSAIRGAAELLQEAGMPADERRRFLANILQETGRIQEVVDRMLELTVLEARRVLDRSEPLDLQAIVSEGVAGALASAERRGVRLVADGTDPAPVEGDPFLLRRALANLVDNALDFAPAGSEVRVTLRADARTVQVEVRDQGPGIPDYARERLFEKFYSLPRPATGRKGTGLGLAFVRKIAALHRGAIRLDNGAGGGAVATLSLPRRGPR